MNENAKEYLVKARENLLKGEDGEAVGCYAVVAIEAPDNEEAAFFGAYANCVSVLSNYGKGEASFEDTIDAYFKMEEILEDAVESVLKSDGAAEEKIGVIKQIAEKNTTAASYIFETKLAPQTAFKKHVQSLYDFSRYIEEKFNSDPEAMKIAIIPLKEAVKIQQKIYANTNNYNAKIVSETVAKIKSIEPSYVMPKKQGCITLA